MQHGELDFLTFGLVLLTAAVLSVPIARRLGLSAIVAYLIAGIVIGPHGLAAFGTPESIIPVSELGVVMLLFLIGLELELGRLVALRRAIFGLGAREHVGIFPEIGRALLQPVVRHHARRKLDEGLGEHALRAVALQHRAAATCALDHHNAPRASWHCGAWNARQASLHNRHRGVP